MVCFLFVFHPYILKVFSKTIENECKETQEVTRSSIIDIILAEIATVRYYFSLIWPRLALLENRELDMHVLGLVSECKPSKSGQAKRNGRLNLNLASKIAIKLSF